MPCLSGPSESRKLPFEISSAHYSEIIHFATCEQCGKSRVAILFQGGRKKFTTRNSTTLETKDQTNSRPVGEAIKSVKPKISSRDCCRGLKDSGSGATAVKIAPAPPQKGRVPWCPWGTAWTGGVTSPKPSSYIFLLSFVSVDENPTVFSSASGTSQLLFIPWDVLFSVSSDALSATI